MQGVPLYPTSEVSALVGCEDAERELVSRLLDGTEENLSVISLVSEEAIGRIALARHVYKRLEIRQHFQCHLWVCVREEFAYKDLLLIILKQIPKCLLKDIELMSQKELRQLVFQTLMKFRNLMVLDDVCTKDIWFNLLRPFADSTNGSRVILTTCHFNVASEADPWSSSLTLRQLTEEESWGLPPAILLLGGLLSTIELSDWSRVIDRSQFGEDKSALLNIVALMSYNELPSVIKPCFLYLALFPKAYEIPKRRLLQLWLAEGFVQLSSDEASVPIEDKAKIYLEELVSRYGFFLPKAEEEGFLHVHHCRSECTSADSEIFKVQRLTDQFGVSKSHIGYLLCVYFFQSWKTRYIQ
ncbi:disease resistance protein RPP13-like [Quercus lobata]|uniref:disease resistance protein RPP13-like n=1 Tax=Quercus lobata TaxID=97700 RepID=UPI00124786E1|nr:disease resistance protein RPP13-like [Quercus lobata]